MVRTEIEHHGLVVDAFHFLAAEKALGVPRHHFHGRFRGKGCHLRSAADVLLAQRMTLPVVGHENATLVGVTFEVDAEHVEDFALVPVGRSPDAGSRRH